MRHRRPREAADTARWSGAGRERCARIMIVDGNPCSLKRAADALALRGYLVEPANDAAQAQRILQHTVPNLILADRGLPGIDGLAHHRDRPDCSLRHVPIIALTASDENDAASRAAAGYDGCIAAPVDDHQLAVQVAAFLVRGPSRRSGGPPPA